MNEAAILAARRNLKEISKEEIADALERIVAGPEKKGAVMSEKKKKLVAYHEVCTSMLSCRFRFLHSPVFTWQVLRYSIPSCASSMPSLFEPGVAVRMHAC